jgi:WD40 repeat protein
MTDVTYSPDGHWIAACGIDGDIFLWDAATEGRRRIIHVGDYGHGTQQVLFTPDSRHLLAANGNGTVYVLRLAERSTPDKGPQPAAIK